MKPTKKILIVEDEISLLNILVDKFTDEGYAVTKSVDGKDGLNKAISEHPDLILLDINLPVMNGIEMLKELRKDEYGKDAEIILLTNYDDYHMVTDALALGAHDYLVKSDWKLEDIVKMVSEKLK